MSLERVVKNSSSITRTDTNDGIHIPVPLASAINLAPRAVDARRKKIRRRKVRRQEHLSVLAMAALPRAIQQNRTQQIRIKNSSDP